MPRRVCLGRFHDGTAKPNWGGRATSLALARCLRRSGGDVVSVINGDLIVNGFGDERPGTDEPDFSDVPVQAEQLLDRTPRPEPLLPVVAALDSADELWMNGEGDLILNTRATLRRTLLLMAIARVMGKRVVLVNSMLSNPPRDGANAQVVAAVGEALARCDAVHYRDPTSLDLHRSLYPEVPASWFPDALFAWSSESTALAKVPVESSYGGPYLEGLSTDVQAVVSSGRPYVAVSGSSALRRGDDRAAASEQLEHLLRELRSLGSEPVVVATGNADRWMRRAARRASANFVPPAIPLVTGTFLLGHARCLVSGRYHPSVLATTAGTPVVLMASNSHKTASLHRVLGRHDGVEHPFLSAEGSEALIAEVADAAWSADDARTALQQQAADLGNRLVFGGPTSGPGT